MILTFPSWSWQDYTSLAPPRCSGTGWSGAQWILRKRRKDEEKWSEERGDERHHAVKWVTSLESKAKCLKLWLIFMNFFFKKVQEVYAVLVASTADSLFLSSIEVWDRNQEKFDQLLVAADSRSDRPHFKRQLFYHCWLLSLLGWRSRQSELPLDWRWTRREHWS